MPAATLAGCSSFVTTMAFDDLSLCWLRPSVVAPNMRAGVEAFLANLRPTGRLPDVHTDLPLEDFAPSEPPPTKCSLGPMPGTALFRRFVMQNLGGSDTAICACRPIAGTLTLSDHSAGKAWDWGVRADRPEDVARVNALMDWLLKPDPRGNPAANFRRVGLRSMIWNRRSWSAAYREWRPYTGQHPHNDHVHFSFSSPGAAAQTSFFQWLEAPSANWWPVAIIGFALGAGGAYALLSR